MKEKYAKLFSAWGKTGQFKRNITTAKSTIQKALKSYNKPYIAYSGGKDSVCMVHLILKYDPSILVHHWDYGMNLMPREFELEIINIAHKLGVTNIDLRTSGRYEFGYEKEWYKIFFGFIAPEYKKKGHDCAFIGLRKEESLKRKRRILQKKDLTDMPEVWPLENWSWLDVWAYIVSNDLPYHSAYDLYAPILGYDRARFVTFFDPEFYSYGSTFVDGCILPQK